ncbi:MAG: SidA/IucD/PvdA family monooxygenase [Aliishimia sp.]
MTLHKNETDILGVGFGPSNLALAIALQERGATLNMQFLEAKPAFAWHPDMMLDGSDMQVSFIKDLVSLRNPASPFSFLSYLHAKGRLERFINRKSFYPSRHEFNDYFSWAAGHFETECDYDQRVVGAEPLRDANGRITRLAVTSESGAGVQSTYLTKNLVLALGGRPLVPDTFAQVAQNDCVVHSSAYLSTVKPKLKQSDKPLKIAVIGSGQSGAEIFYDLVNDPHNPQVDFIFRSHALKPSDDSPFVNEIFNVDFTSYVYQQTPERRRAIMKDFSNTNYSVVDGDLISQIYGVFYEQDVVGGSHYTLRRATRVKEARFEAGQVRLDLGETHGTQTDVQGYDLVILATGFKRRIGETILSDLKDYVTDAEVGRTYQMATTDEFQPRIFLQGYCEESHGLSDTLLSVLAARVDEIANELVCSNPTPLMSAAE